MLRMLLKPNLPGGLSFLEALGAGLAAGQDPSMQPDSVVNIEPTGNLFKSNITITPRTQGSLLSGQEVVQIGLKQALLMPKAAAGLVHRFPPAAYAMYEPIKNLGDFVSSPFRRGTLPRITGQEGLPTLGELIQDALAGARIAVGMPPSPLGPNGSLGSIAAVAGAAKIWDALQGFLSPGGLGGQKPQGWGTQNGPERITENTLPSNYSGSITGTYSPTGTNVVAYSGNYQTKVWNGTGVGCAAGTFPITPNAGLTITGGISGVQVELSGFGNCGGSNNRIDVYIVRANGSKVTIGNLSGGGGVTGAAMAISISSTAANAIPVQGNLYPSETSPWLGLPADLDSPSIAPAPLPLPAYDPQPATVPAVPDAEPVTQPEPATPAEPPQRIAPPVTVPSSPPWISPSRPGSTPGSVPGYFPSQNPTLPTQPVAPDGTVTPTQPGPVTQTQPGSVVPWPGAPSIPAIGPAPRADLVGIAQEVGRIERKIDLMNTPGSGSNGFENLSELLGLLGQIWEFLTASTSGTTYTLDSPCEVDEEGVKLPPIEIDAPGAATTFEALLNRTDALAELIQAHKNLKQPGCKHKLAGEIVTVNFQQIE